ncbi:MAG TPA: hypothetical protein VKZ54_00305 [Membranihabitans sp.]|nr:hypothetical protein [Membranihabitans sp.]
MKTNPIQEYTYPSFAGFVGVSEIDITPPVGIYMGNWGASTSPVSTGTHLPLKITCLTFQTDRTADPLVMMGMDLGWWKDGSEEITFRKTILQKFDLEPHQLMIFLSHTHSGPSICRMDSDKPGGDLVVAYLDELEEKAISVIRSALETAEESFLTWQYGHCDLARNRDLPDPHSPRYLVGYHPEAKADNTLLCGLVTDKMGLARGVIVNYACHPTTLGWTNTLISPDFPGAMKRTIIENTGAPVLFMQGASGELAPIINYSGDTAVPDRYGRQLGYAVLSTLESIAIPGRKYAFDGSVESGAPLAIWTAVEAGISNELMAYQYLTRYQIKDFPKYKDLKESMDHSKDRVERERLWRKMAIRKAIGDGDEVNTGLWVWKLGDAWVIAQPNEAYSELQVGIRTMFPDLAIAVANLVNGSYGYLPPEDLYQEDIYAVWQTPFAKGSLEQLTSQVCEIIRNLNSTP